MKIILKSQFYFLAGNECTEAAQTFPLGKIIQLEKAEFIFHQGRFLP